MADTSLHGRIYGGSGNQTLAIGGDGAQDLSYFHFPRRRYVVSELRTRREYIHVGSCRPSMASNGPEYRYCTPPATIVLILRWTVAHKKGLVSPRALFVKPFGGTSPWL